MGYTIDADGTLVVEWHRGRVVMDEATARFAFVRNADSDVVGEVRWWHNDRNIFEVIVALSEEVDTWLIYGGSLLDNDAVRADARGELELFVRSLWPDDAVTIAWDK